MAYPDPQELTIGVTADIPLPRVSSGPNSGVFKTADDGLKLTISHAVGKRARRTIRIDTQKTSPDVFLPSTNVTKSASIYVVVDTPLAGFTVEELTDIMLGLTGYLSENSAEHTTRLLGGES
jgi:hypothetical protein